MDLGQTLHEGGCVVKQHNGERRVVVIIGGTGGIGLESARKFAEQGNAVVVMGREPEQIPTAVDGIRERAMAPDDIVGVSGDASNREDVSKVFRMVSERFGHLEALVHVAGVSGRRWGDGPLDACTDEAWDMVMQNNLRSVFLSNQHALRMMKAQQAGAIVNVSSILGMVGTQDHFCTHAYSASKGAIISMSRAAAVYYARDHIRINTVCPGLLDTPMSQRAVNDPTIRQALTVYQPLEPHVGYPQDVAEAILFLVSSSARFITGIVLPVDGGWTAQ